MIYFFKWDPRFIFDFHLSLLCFILLKSNLKWIWFIVVRLILFSSIYKMRLNKLYNKLQQIHLWNFKKRNNQKNQKHKNCRDSTYYPIYLLKLIKGKKGSCDSERQNKNLNNRNTDWTYCQGQTCKQTFLNIFWEDCFHTHHCSNKTHPSIAKKAKKANFHKNLFQKKQKLKSICQISKP